MWVSRAQSTWMKTMHRSFSVSQLMPSPVPPSRFTLRIGLELHVQLLTVSKLFSRGSPTSLSHLSPIDIGVPGCLPSAINRSAVIAAVRSSIAFGCHISPTSRFVRKHYKYSDLPVGYQISQLALPISSDGVVVVPSQGSTPLRVRIARIQLEQDSGKSIHDVIPMYSCIDFTRCGSPLVELVLHPDLKDSKSAVDTILFIVRTMKSIGATEGRMGDGHVRCDVNVSIHEESSGFNGERVEIKNLNSVRSVQKAIDVEYRRQIQMAEKGVPIVRETRCFDLRSAKTSLLRTKEDLLDYRFIDDPDLPVLHLSTEQIDAISHAMPKTLQQRFDELHSKVGGHLKDSEVRLILSTAGALEIFTDIVETFPSVPVSNVFGFMFSEVRGQMVKRSLEDFSEVSLTSKSIGEILRNLSDGNISSNIAKKIVSLKLDGDKRDIGDIIRENEWSIEKEGSESTAEESIVNAFNAVFESPLGQSIFTRLQREHHLIGDNEMAKFIGVLVGRTLAELKGRALPAEIRRIVDTQMRMKLGKGKAMNDE